MTLLPAVRRQHTHSPLSRHKAIQARMCTVRVCWHNVNISVTWLCSNWPGRMWCAVGSCPSLAKYPPTPHWELYVPGPVPAAVPCWVVIYRWERSVSRELSVILSTPYTGSPTNSTTHRILPADWLLTAQQTAYCLLIGCSHTVKHRQWQCLHSTASRAAVSVRVHTHMNLGRQAFSVSVWNSLPSVITETHNFVDSWKLTILTLHFCNFNLTTLYLSY